MIGMLDVETGEEVNKRMDEADSLRTNDKKKENAMKSLFPKNVQTYINYLSPEKYIAAGKRNSIDYEKHGQQGKIKTGKLLFLEGISREEAVLLEV